MLAKTSLVTKKLAKVLYGSRINDLIQTQVVAQKKLEYD